MDLDTWQIVTMACGLLFSVCYAVLLVQHLRAPVPSTWVSGQPVQAAILGVGIILLTLASTMPLPRAVGDAGALVGCLLMLGGFIGPRDRTDSQAESERESE